MGGGSKRGGEKRWGKKNLVCCWLWGRLFCGRPPTGGGSRGGDFRGRRPFPIGTAASGPRTVPFDAVTPFRSPPKAGIQPGHSSSATTPPHVPGSIPAALIPTQTPGGGFSSRSRSTLFGVLCLPDRVSLTELQHHHRPSLKGAGDLGVLRRPAPSYGLRRPRISSTAVGSIPAGRSGAHGLPLGRHVYGYAPIALQDFSIPRQQHRSVVTMCRRRAASRRS